MARHSRIAAVAGTLASIVGCLLQVVHGADEPLGVRQTVEAYLTAVLAGKVEAAVALGLPNSAAASKARINEFNQRFDAKAIKVTSAHASPVRDRAFVVTEVVKLKDAEKKGPNQGPLVIKLSWESGRWLVRDVDLTTAESAKTQLNQFLEKFRNAKPVPEK